MLMKRLLLCLWMLAGLLWLQSNPVAAQEKKFQIKGRVTNSAQEPLEGVSVVIKGGQQGTSTDKNGLFTIMAPNGYATLVFSSIGFATREEKVNGRSQVAIALLVEATKALSSCQNCCHFFSIFKEFIDNYLADCKYKSLAFRIILSSKIFAIGEDW